MGGNSSINTRFFLFCFTLRWLVCVLRLAIAADTLSSNQSIKEDTLSSNQSIKDGDILISANKRFQLRFFSPLGDTNRYVGIWLDTGEFGSGDQNKTVWVANRENRLQNTTGILSLTPNGNLVVSYGTGGKVVWSTNLTAARPTTNGSVAKLEDNGNLVVRELDSGAVLWESFDLPCDTLLPGMKIGINLKTRWSRVLTAWRSEYDPAPGIYSFGIDPQDLNQFFVWRKTIPYSRIIFGNGSNFNIFMSSVPVDKAIQNASIVLRDHDEVYLTIFPSLGQLSWLVIGPSATLRRYSARSSGVDSGDISSRISCSGDGVCGPHSSCNENEDPMCKCLPGYKPTSQAEWNSGYWTSGCTQKLELQCGGKDGYLTLTKVKLPAPSHNVGATNASTCKQECNDRECSCKAWAFINDDGCQIYKDEINNLEEDADDDYRTGSVLSEVNIRVAYSLLSQEGRRCGTCGTNIIPYPLSTEPTCGDPEYGSFFCNSSSGLLHFLVSNVTSYIVSSIKPETRTFVIKPRGIDLCWARSDQRMDIHLNSSLPFHVSNNNTVLLLNCSIDAPDKMSHLNCSSSSPCYHYIQEGGAPCFRQKTCCSDITRGSNSNTSHSVGVLESGCDTYASIYNLDPSTLSIIDWKEGVQIEWDAPQEPVCFSEKDCNGWPNSSCRAQKSAIRGKRCLCNENFLWDPLSMNCTLGSKRNKHLVMILIVTTTTAAGIFLFIAFIYYVRRSKTRRKGLPVYEFLQLASGNDIVEVPMVDLKCITKATKNFSDSNKLGRGGFGPVYKGVLLGGQEIAIKKLSRYSGQGLEEFKNEVSLIAKLQHRNLVRMLGYCIDEDEKMLIYEYMPNRSLDFFLFDLDRRTLLDWEKRFNIIMGVTRGLLYLHQDSRLRIIHRDMKTSNILLDKDMSPKISDFGLARIIGGDQNQETTNRVVGTYGYMAPEYAADGLFSVKSDVFSFGIIMLEIISGRKNAGFYNDENASNLTGYAWLLWKEERGFNLLDPSLCDSSNLAQVLRCIHLALLCVQENAEDRPTMASMLIALETEEVSLPAPRKPAFFRSGFRTRRPPLNQKPTYSNNNITLSTLEGR